MPKFKVGDIIVECLESHYMFEVAAIQGGQYILNNINSNVQFPASTFYMDKYYTWNKKAAKVLYNYADE